jgi:hypothetical protein
MTPRQLIETAIERGAPMFNRGDTEACAAIYEVTARSLVMMDDVPAAAKDRLASALDEIQGEHHASNRAWTLRYALDAAYNRMPMQTSVRQASADGGCSGSMNTQMSQMAGR